MKFVALISGGKDSIFNILHCLANDHDLVALANLRPANKSTQELDSFMFQTVGHDVLDLYPEVIGLPLYRGEIKGSSKNQSMDYEPTKEDEIEDLYELLLRVKTEHPEVEGVSVGAILSSYQRTRVENVCSRLGLTSLAYLWQRDQGELMAEMVGSPMEAIFIKVAAVGLNQRHLGLTLKQGYSQLLELNRKFDLHICGEGGEFETLVIDAPFFKKRLVVVDQEITAGNDDVCYLHPKMELQEKESWYDLNDKTVNWSGFITKKESLLTEEFQSIHEEQEQEDLQIEASTSSLQFKNKPMTTVKLVNNKLYISNIQPSSTSTSESVEDQTHSIFRQLNYHLSKHNLTTTAIQHSSLLISSMSNFATVNSIYVTHFNTAPIPPSRVCVQTNLPEGCLIQLSVIAILNPERFKSGLHVQGRSYWAPANIGPYSQSVIDLRDNVASLSGQIPLIPSSMELSTKDVKFNAVLSLQHLENVKRLIGCVNQLSITSFVKSPESVRSVVSTWKSYSESSDFNAEHPNDCLLVVQVEELPRGADVEWGGFSFKKVVDMYADDSDEEDDLESQLSKLSLGNDAKVHKANEGSFFSTFTLTYSEFAQFKLDQKLHYTVYTTPEFIRSGTEDVSIDYIPVRGVWGYDGQKGDVGVVVSGVLL